MILSVMNSVAFSPFSARRLALVSVFCIGAGLTGAAAHAGDVDVTLNGVRSGGNLYISLQSRGEFMENNGTAGEIFKDVRGGTLSVTLEDVPDGAYAARQMVEHDLQAEQLVVDLLRKQATLAESVGDRATRYLYEEILLKTEDRAFHLAHFLAEDTLLLPFLRTP